METAPTTMSAVAWTQGGASSGSTVMNRLPKNAAVLGLVMPTTNPLRQPDGALVAALAANTGYVGALGSRKSHAARLQRLTEAGVSAEDLARIDGPVGLDIGAIGPAEIALSIASAMVKAFHDRG